MQWVLLQYPYQYNGMSNTAVSISNAALSVSIIAVSIQRYNSQYQYYSGPVSVIQ